MSEHGSFHSQRTRTIVGAVVVAAALAAAGVLGGVGFAKSSVSAAQSQYGKTTLCHKTHSKKHPSVSITVSPSAVPAHTRHGDTMGACATTTTTTTTTVGTTTTTTETTTTTLAAATASSPGKSGAHGNSSEHGHKKK